VRHPRGREGGKHPHPRRAHPTEAMSAHGAPRPYGRQTGPSARHRRDATSVEAGHGRWRRRAPAPPSSRRQRGCHAPQPDRAACSQKDDAPVCRPVWPAPATTAGWCTTCAAPVLHTTPEQPGGGAERRRMAPTCRGRSTAPSVPPIKGPGAPDRHLAPTLGQDGRVRGGAF